jgi:thiol-disulfide isomerase/thioredoxin
MPMSNRLRLPLPLLFLALAGPVRPAAAGDATSAAAGSAPAAREAGATDASRLDLDALHGKVVYVDFWASWCAPCRKSFPWLNDLQKKYGEQGLVVIGVNVDRDPQKAEKFLDTFPPGFRIVYDPKGKLAEQYALKGMPSTFVFGRDGKQAWTHVGFRDSDREELERNVRALLAPVSDGG